MSKNRLEAFSDGVIAIIITIMVLEIKVPLGHDWSSLKPLLPTLLSYTLSFIYIGIYWNNHHHLLHAAKAINASIMWANLYLLFWLSLIPFVTAWFGKNDTESVPAALYGIVLVLAAVAYTFLQRAVLAHRGKNSELSKAIGHDLKGKFSILIYLMAVGIAFFQPRISAILYCVVALMWLVPDKRLEKAG